MSPEARTNQGSQPLHEGGSQSSRIIERVTGQFKERDQRTQGHLLAALDSLAAEGHDWVSGYEIAKRDNELRDPGHPYRMMGHGTVYGGLDQLIKAGQLSLTWADLLTEHPKKPIFSRVEQPESK